MLLNEEVQKWRENREYVVIFGTGDVAQIANFFFKRDTNWQVLAFTVDKAYIKEKKLEGLPVIPFEEIEKQFPPNQVKIFVALSYSKMNKLREAKYMEAKKKGYSFVSYVSSRCTYISQFPPGENCFIFEDNTVQPYVKIGNNVVIWSGNHIGHHSEIQDHVFISSHVVISGHCTIKKYSFLGVNSTLRNGITIEEGTLVGAGVTILKNTEPYKVYVAQKPIIIPKRSDEVEI